jgi:chorismate dehydratase
MGPDLAQMLDRCDGALLIGDRALDEAARHPELVRMDLGATWREITGYPMVFAVFAARKDAPPSQLHSAHAVLKQNLISFENSTDIRQNVIEETARRGGFTPDRISTYFGEVINRLDEDGVKGLNHFLQQVCEIDINDVITINH